MLLFGPIELFFVVLLLSVLVYFQIRTTLCRQARTRADQIINGKRLASVDELNKIITRLLSTKTWGHDITEADRRRVKLLRDIRDTKHM